MHPSPSERALLLPASRTRRRRALISLTPLVDVVLILLVFFMLASSFRDWRAIALEAGVGGGNGAATPMEGALLVEVLPGGVRLSGEPVSLDSLAARVARHAAERPDLRVLIKPARGVVLQETVRVLDALSAAGVTGLSLIRGSQGEVSAHAL